MRTDEALQTDGRSGAGEVLGVPISLAGKPAVLAAVDDRIRARTPGGYISITNTESMYHALRHADHLAYIRAAELSLCDGVGVIVAGWFWGLRLNRYNGPVLQLDCSDYGRSRGWRHFFYGGGAGVADLMAQALRQRFPGIDIVGTYSPPFRELSSEEDAAVVRLINDAQPDIVWVGLGLLKQENWIARHLTQLNAPWMVGVGGAFDYHSGVIPWAPAPIRAIGLEWLFRLIVQPRLRARRYWWSLVFVVEAIVAGLTRAAKYLLLWSLRVPGGGND
jgi:N-acetylglucosaminyldiphosphoundecaprenol N-acetyl-beta-D-mannosaminyltransferase